MFVVKAKALVCVFAFFLVSCFAQTLDHIIYLLAGILTHKDMASKPNLLTQRRVERKASPERENHNNPRGQKQHTENLLLPGELEIPDSNSPL